MGNNDNENLITQDGYNKLVSELEELKTNGREKVKNEISAARDFGDLSENAEYSSAKDAQAELELRIKVLEYKILNAQIVDEKNISSKIVGVGTYVKIYDEEFDEELVYQIVGSSESDPIKGLISNISPVGAALMNKKKGDVVEFETPSGINKLKILEISKKPL